ncbi:ATP-binding protein [Paracoccus onubensis]|uniref:AAA family ATPase n=1 Tax=Paracoccus onubensis TaxID=1675788 RepID=UPI002730EB1E|nr:ATP-binding protein [Paracoccus onubensis]MDP0929395.1 ATP-binding protein [Paracoccus onubensis]
MARSDLLISLVKAGSSGDAKSVRAAAEAIIAEEKAKNHNILAERLTSALHVNGNGHKAAPVLGTSVSRHKEFLLELIPQKRIEELVLSELNRHACEELIEEQRRASILRAHSLEPRHRVLLSGPPGNGKTSLAEAIAEALALPFFVVRYEAMIGSYLGETASRLKRVFDYARTTPCVLFFDEFDAVGKERGDEHETGEIKRVVTSLLMQMDDLPSYTIVVAATNHSELLDRAVWRRFQLRLSLNAPTKAELTAYFQRFAESMVEPLGRAPGTIAKALGSISYAEAEEFCLDVRRRHVLAMGDTPLKKIVEGRLKMWAARTSPNAREDVSHDRLPPSAGPEAGA